MPQRKTVLVTGGSSGIGFAIARRFLQEKFLVIITGRNKEKLDKAVDELGEGCNGILFDMEWLDQIPEFVQGILQANGSIDVLVNNAGINQKKPILEVSNEDFERIVRVNQTAVFVLSREVAKAMVNQPEKGVIIHISSMAAHYGLPQVIAYTSTKSALEGMTPAMAVELSPMGIRVNCIAPGFIRTAMSSKALDNDPERKQKVLSRTPAGHLGDPADVADAVFFLASDQARFITGEILRVDGGNAIGF
ncbi:MAG TPA: SDR family oxidoreductase [Saprospiraceae bacterium]|nr:SDR family oxidoreductase [Saprospiraceae bacterium]HMQ81699.1 SDR family oxidoreductase [Saprospiraceae bacterium]